MYSGAFFQEPNEPRFHHARLLGDRVLTDARVGVNDLVESVELIIAPRDVRRVRDLELAFLEIRSDGQSATRTEPVLVDLERDQPAFFVQRVQERQIAGSANHGRAAARRTLRFCRVVKYDHGGTIRGARAQVLHHARHLSRIVLFGCVEVAKRIDDQQWFGFFADRQQQFASRVWRLLIDFEPRTPESQALWRIPICEQSLDSVLHHIPRVF